jgi:hypothetical protein
MANTISANASVTSVVDSVRTTVSTNTSTPTSSSNFIAGNAVVTGSAWTNVTVGTLSDVLLLTVYNDPTVYSASVITLASGSAGIGPIAILTPGAQAIIPWSGSLTTISAKVVGSYANSTFSPTTVQAGLGNIQFLAQQS